MLRLTNAFRALANAGRWQPVAPPLLAGAVAGAGDAAAPIPELAPLLGYSETSAFSRAFRRWFDASPRQWLQMSTA